MCASAIAIGIAIASGISVVANNDMQSRRNVIQFEQNIFSMHICVRVCVLINFPFYTSLFVAMRCDSMRFENLFYRYVARTISTSLITRLFKTTLSIAI